MQLTVKQLINRVINVKNIVFFLLSIFSTQVHAQEVQCIPEPINIQEGDVVSADVLNEILTRINNVVTGGLTNSDVIGTWNCTSRIRQGASGTNNGYSQNALSIFTVTQDLVITEFDDKNIKLNYPHNLGQGFSETGAQECLAIVDNGIIYITGKPGNTGTQCSNTGQYEITKKASQCFVMENINDSRTSCTKKNIPPAAPTSLAATVTSGSIALTWKAGDVTEESYDIQRKSSATGEYSSISLPTTESYTDSTGVRTVTYWYRVFAKNTYGTSIGSNVISVVAQ